MKILVQNNKDIIEVDCIRKTKNGLYELSYNEVIKLLKDNKFNDDSWGQIFSSYEGEYDEDPNWIYIENTQDDDDYEMFVDYDHFFLDINNTVKVIQKSNENVLLRFSDFK